MVSIEARDPELAANVHDIKVYRPPDVRFGVRFGDAVSPAEDGTLIVDLTRISVLDGGG